MALRVSKDALVVAGTVFVHLANGNVKAWTTNVNVVGGVQVDAYYQSAGDPLFTFAGSVLLEATDDEFDVDLLNSASLLDQPATPGQPTWRQIKDDNAPWVDPNTQQTFYSFQAISAAFGYIVSAMTDHEVLTATANQWIAFWKAKIQAALDTIYGPLVIPVYVPPTAPTETGQFPPSVHGITSGLGLAIADNLLMNGTVDPQDAGRVLVGFNPPPPV